MINNTTDSISSSDQSSDSSQKEFDSVLEITFRLPNLETIKVDISGLESLYVRDLKKRLNAVGAAIPSSKMKLMYANRVVQDRELIGDVGMKAGDIVYVILSLTSGEEVAPKYDDFILSTSPKHLSVNVPLDLDLSVTLRANLFDQAIFTNSLLAESNVQSLNNGKMVQNLNNDTLIAESKGFRKWYEDKGMRSKVLLLQVAEDLDMKLESIRYNVDGINTGYCKGDGDSWQRYTNHLPIPCNILVSSFFDPLPHIVRICPREPLQPNTQYAIVLQNNVPIRPLSLPHYSIEFFSESTGDDKVIMFKTEKIRGKIGARKNSPDRDRRRNVLL